MSSDSTNFGYEVHAMTGNGSYMNLLQNPPKIREISCLRQFDKFLDMKQVHAMTGNGCYVNLTETCFRKIREITSAGEIIFGGCHFETLCSTLDNYYIEASIEKSTTFFAEN